MIDTLNAILAAHGLPPACMITPLAAGRNNPIYLIDDAYVLRFDGLTGELETSPELTTRFRAEQWVYDCLYAVGLPVPRVLAVDDSRSLAPQQYMLMTQVAGRGVIDSDELTSAQRVAVASQFGAFLACMHGAASFDRFGKWHQLEDGTHLTRWAEWPAVFFEKYARQSDELGGAADPALVRDMRHLIDEALPYFDAVTTGVIAHRDAHPGNAMQLNGRLTGVIDFEWWMAADAAADFAVMDQWEAFGAGSIEAIYDAYTALRPLTFGHDRKVSVYHLLRYFDDVVSYYAAGDMENSRRAAEYMRRYLNTI